MEITIFYPQNTVSGLLFFSTMTGSIAKNESVDDNKEIGREVAYLAI